jgi:radical SAM protein with 4Fe4S-binding SPASM domain
MQAAKWPKWEGTAMHMGAASKPQPAIGKPRLIFWEVTKGCNLRCIHCRATATELSSPLDLPNAKARQIIEEIAAYANPILVLSGGEPLYRRDIFELAALATERGLRVALATNGTLVDQTVAAKIKGAGVKRVSISLDGADPETHDQFRGIPGAFQKAVDGLRNLQQIGVSVQINMTIARHNAHQLPRVLELAQGLGADALHTFLLVPVGCGVEIADRQMVPPDEYERILNWFYDRSLEGGIELKATCAPHYFRVMRQRRAQERREAGYGARPAAPPAAGAIGPTEALMPSGVGIVINQNAELQSQPANSERVWNPMAGHSLPAGHAGHPDGMNAMTKGCLAGTGVCFISFEGGVYPCGYLPVQAGDLKRQSFQEVWEQSATFAALRDTGNLKGKCGICEFRNVCMGCRARAYAATGDMMDEEPFCVYQPGKSSVVGR